MRRTCFGSQRVTVMQKNVTNNVITLRNGNVIAKLAATNMVLNKIALWYVKPEAVYFQAHCTQMQAKEVCTICVVLKKSTISLPIDIEKMYKQFHGQAEIRRYE